LKAPPVIIAEGSPISHQASTISHHCRRQPNQSLVITAKPSHSHQPSIISHQSSVISHSWQSQPISRQSKFA
jgi:hypothetical protein